MSESGARAAYLRRERGSERGRERGEGRELELEHVGGNSRIGGAWGKVADSALCPGGPALHCPAVAPVLVSSELGT